MPDTRSPISNRMLNRVADRFRPVRRGFFRKSRILFLSLSIIIGALGYRGSAWIGDLRGADNSGAVLTKPKESLSNPESFGFNKIAELFSRKPPNLNGDRDTFQTDNGTLIVYYSLDMTLQNFIDRMMKRYRPRYGACAVIDPKTGRVLALVSYEGKGVLSGGRFFLRNIFPAASVYKTITAAAAIEAAQYTFQTKVPVIGREHTLYRSQLRREFQPWKELPFEDAFAHSINPAFGRIGMYVVGKKVLEEYSLRFGFNTMIPFELPVDSSKVSVPDDTAYAMAEFASGYNRKTSISPLHGALIASAVAEDGVMPCPRVVDSIFRMDGQCLYRYPRRQFGEPRFPAALPLNFGP